MKDVETRIPGVQEDTTDVLLNVKKLAVNVPSGEPTRDPARGQRAPSRSPAPTCRRRAGVEVLNPEIHIATLAAGATLAIDLGIGVGRGYVAADRHPAGTIPAGAIAVDAAFSPIQRVSYNVENARLGKVTDYEKLILEIWTNGAVSPDEALSRAARHLQRPLRPPGAGGARGGRGRGGGDRRGLPAGEPRPSRSRSCRCPRAPSTR